MRILVTGSTGFVGNALLSRFSLNPIWQLRGTVRHHIAATSSGTEFVRIGGLAADTDWSSAIANIDVVVHTAARVHVMRDTATDPLVEFRRVNVEGTLNLARQAMNVGVRRFIFVSSIKVNGEVTIAGRPYTADDIPSPIDPYGISKYEAEQGLHQLAQETGMEVVIIRPVLVYGPGVKANFLSMMYWLYKGIPLPFGAIHNQRSFVALDNLADLITTCIYHPAAANQIFLVSDDDDISTTELLQRMGIAMGRPTRLIPVPTQVLQVAFRLLGKADFFQRLCGSLQVDISKTRKLLGWTPPVSADEALKQTAQHFLANF